MDYILLTSVEYGQYISVFKFAVYMALFFLWVPLVGWVYADSEAVGTKQTAWTGAVFSTAAAASLAFLLMPLFIVAILLYLIALSAVSVSYIMHRNSKVPEFQKVLTVEHLKGLFVSEQKKQAALQDLTFITANDNEVPVPAAKSGEFAGYKAAFDLFGDAIWRRASDIVFMPSQHNYNVLYYVDGVGLKQPQLPREQGEPLVYFLKSLGDLDTKERRKPQKGTFTTVQGEAKTTWEITTAGSTAGERIAVRQSSRHAVTRLGDIGMTADQMEKINGFRGVREGVFIISGPPASGVTTTLYAFLKNHDPFMYNINTFEKQPSAELPNITQNVFSLSDTGTTTYSKKLQAIVRMGPDIMGVGDCNDSEAAKVICNGAADGKLFYVTLEADAVMQALAKWIKLVGDRKAAVRSLLGLCNQRLLRILCSECRQAYQPDAAMLKKFNISGEKNRVFYRPGKVQYDKHGKPQTCEDCQGTGFVGRTGVFEMIVLDEALRSVILKSKSLGEITSAFRRAKMLYLQEQSLVKVINGVTAVNEIVRVLAPKDKKPPKQKEVS